jgi:hypothetical protein
MLKELFNKLNLTVYVVTFVLSFGLAYAVVEPDDGFRLDPTGSADSDEQSSSGFSQFANEPKTEVCPINNMLYTKSEKDLWSTKRPILTMIENSPDARPHSGLSLADVVYEAVAEGGVTRFMGVFYCGAQADSARVAPVRSARIYFVNLAAEYNTPIYMHVGGANCSRDEASGQCISHRKTWAIEELAKLGWRRPGGNDFDTIGDVGKPVLFRDATRLNRQVATEHTMVGSLPDAWREAQKRKFTNLMPNGKEWLDGFRPWQFSEGLALTGTPASTVSFDFWKNYKDFSVDWKYDSTKGVYFRSQGGQPQMDLDTDEQISAANVIVQFAKEESGLDALKHLYYDLISQGKGIYFQNGQAVDIKWQKTRQDAKTVYTDAKTNQEILLAPGKIWIHILPAGNIVSYQ